MTETTSPSSYSGDYWSEDPFVDAKQKSPKIPMHKKQKEESFPIDEVDEFHDPYSELSLFLSKRIKKEVEKNGDTKKWSQKIQEDLLTNILPEFKKTFPKYRLGASALKKVWDKVSYFYSRVKQQSGAIQENGKLNVEFLIRENLKQQKYKKAPLHLPPYNSAQQLALKMSECIATLDCIRPNLDHLTRLIWVVQKHLIQDLSPMQAKSPYEEYGIFDKLIVKGQLEYLAKHPHSEPSKTMRSVKRYAEKVKSTKTLIENNSLQSIISYVLAKKLYPQTFIARFCSSDQMEFLHEFVDRQLQVIRQYRDFSLDAQRIELVGRLMAIYPVTQLLPETIQGTTLRRAIRYLYAVNAGYEPSVDPEIDQAVGVFINAEMHLYPDKENEIIPEEIEQEIIDSYQIAISLPKLKTNQLDDLEIFFWKTLGDVIEIENKIDPQLLKVIEQEVANHLMDKPRQTFSTLVKSCNQYFLRLSNIDFEETNKKMELNEKIELWAHQGDLICRFIHFDPDNPLMKLTLETARMMRGKNPNITHKEVVENIYKQALEQNTKLIPFSNQLKQRVWILYKYCWYHLFSSPRETTFHRFEQWLRIEMPNASTEDLQAIAEKVFALDPVYGKTKMRRNKSKECLRAVPSQ